MVFAWKTKRLETNIIYFNILKKYIFGTPRFIGNNFLNKKFLTFILLLIYYNSKLQIFNCMIIHFTSFSRTDRK